MERCCDEEEDDDLDLVSMTLTPRSRLHTRERRASRGFLSRVASAIDPEGGTGTQLQGGHAPSLAHCRTSSASPGSSCSSPTVGGGPHGGAHFRLVVLGAARVGKTSLIKRFLYGKIPDNYSATIEEMHKADFSFGGSSFTLDILDTSGSYQFPVMRRLAVERGDAFVLVFAVDDSESFEEVRRLHDILMELRPSGAPTVIIANKCDLDPPPTQEEQDEEQTDGAGRRCVHREIAEALVCMDWEMAYSECSALKGSGVIEAFRSLLKQAQKLGKLPSGSQRTHLIGEEHGRARGHLMQQGPPHQAPVLATEGGPGPSAARSRMRRRSLPVNPVIVRPPPPPTSPLPAASGSRKRNSCAVS